MKNVLQCCPIEICNKQTYTVNINGKIISYCCEKGFRAKNRMRSVNYSNKKSKKK